MSSSLCWDNYFSLSSWIALLDELASDPEDTPIKAILYLWASSVAFWSASSIAASSWSLLAFYGFFTASTDTVKPFPVLISIY